MEFKTFFKRDNHNEPTFVGRQNDRKKAVMELVNYAEKQIDYCLDSKEDRINSLMTRNWYVCGCGPSELIIEEVE